jgi:hypothetical protein
VLTVVLSLFALAVAGCGGGGSGSTLSKKDYENKLKSVTTQVQKDFGAMQGKNDPNQVAGLVDQAQKSLDNAANQLDGVKPPSDVNADNDKLVTGLHYVAGQLPQLKAAVQKKDLGAIQKLQQNLSTAPQVTGMRTGAQDLKKKGYDIGALGQ